MKKFEDVVLENTKITSFRASANGGMASSQIYPLKASSNKDDISKMLSLLKNVENGFEKDSSGSHSTPLCYPPTIHLTLFKGDTEIIDIEICYDGYVYLYEITEEDSVRTITYMYKSVDKVNTKDFFELYNSMDVYVS